jgi:hypothetical protein
MTTKKNTSKRTSNANSNPTAEVKRGPGRPPSMPGETMKNHLVRVATDVPDLIGELASAQKMSRGAFVTTLIRKEAERRNKTAARKAARTAS